MLLTTAPNGLVALIHDRIPVILAPEDEALWLDPEVTAPFDVLGCPGPYPTGLMMGYQVSTAVNAVANDGPELVRPLRGTADADGDRRPQGGQAPRRAHMLD